MNDLYFIFYEPRLMYLDTIGMSKDAKVAHRQLCDYVWFNDGPPQNDNEALKQICSCTDTEWGSVKRELLGKGWCDKTSYFLHRGAVKSLNESKKKYVENYNRTAAANKVKKLKLSEPDPITGVTPIVTCDVTPIVTLRNNNHNHNHNQGKHEREGVGSFAERPAWEEVSAHAQRIGLAEWKARDWFDEMEGCGWLDYNHRPVANWQSVLNRVRTKWEADGRPMQPPSNQTPAAGQPRAQRPLSVMDLKSIIATKEEAAQQIKNRYCSEVAMGSSWNDPVKRGEYMEIRKEIKALKERLGKMA